ncbi:Hypothetical protein NTJ_03166 [Nesidiocoris tenuis]|uniref:Uncharacterized protein n=1 Tax=Nesidiocoris tenuis TaxID=355587 RepID=A0ABN7ADJ6_9HEMI|nr:Hypothetical protein NTJ_03166 [Nesidiocoris tenuis]
MLCTVIQQAGPRLASRYRDEMSRYHRSDGRAAVQIEAEEATYTEYAHNNIFPQQPGCQVLRWKRPHWNVKPQQPQTWSNKKTAPSLQLRVKID